MPKKMIEYISFSTLSQYELDEEGEPLSERHRTVNDNTDNFEQFMRSQYLSSPQVTRKKNILDLESETLLLPFSITQILPKFYLWIKHNLILEILKISFKFKFLRNLVILPNAKPEDLETEFNKELPRKTILKTYITSSLSDEYPLLLAKRFISEVYTHVYSEEESYFNGNRDLEFLGERGAFAFNLIKVRIANWLQYIQEDTCTWIKPDIGGQSEYYFIVIKNEMANTKQWPIYKNKDMEDLLELFDSYEYLNLNNPLIAKFRIGNPIFYHEGGESEIVSRHKLTGRRKHMIVRRGFDTPEPYQEADTHFNEVDIADSEVYPEHSEIFLKKKWYLETDTTTRIREHSSEISRLILTYKPKSAADLYMMFYDSIQDVKAMERHAEYQGKVLTFLLGQNFPQKVRAFILSIKTLIFSSVFYKKSINFLFFFKKLFKSLNQLIQNLKIILIIFYEILPISLQLYLYQIYNNYYIKNKEIINMYLIKPIKDLIKIIRIKTRNAIEFLIKNFLKVLYQLKVFIDSKNSTKRVKVKNKHIYQILSNQKAIFKNKIIQKIIQDIRIKLITNYIKEILNYIKNFIKVNLNYIINYLNNYLEIIQNKGLIFLSKFFPLFYEDFKTAYKDNEGLFLDIRLKCKAFFKGMYTFFKDFYKDFVTPFFKSIVYYKVTVQIYLKHIYKTKRFFKKYRYRLGNIRTFLRACKRIFLTVITDKRFYLNLPLTLTQIFYYIFILPIFNFIYNFIIIAYKKQVIRIITQIQKNILQNFDKRYNSQLTYLDVINQKRFTYKEFFLNSIRYHDKAINPDTFTRSLHIQFLHNDKILWTQESQYNIYNYFSYHALLTKMHTFLFNTVFYLIYAHLFFFLIFDLILQEKSLVINTLIFATEPFLSSDFLKPTLKNYKFHHGSIAHVRGVHAKKTNYSIFELYTDKEIMPISKLPIRSLLYYKTVFKDLFQEFKKIGTKYYKKHIRYFIKYFQINKYLKIILNYIAPPIKFCMKIYFKLKKFFFQFNEVYIEPLYVHIYIPLIRNPIINIYKLFYNIFNFILKIVNEFLFSYFTFFYEKFILIFDLLITILKLPFNFYWYELLIKPWNDLFIFIKCIIFEPIFALTLFFVNSLFTQITLFYSILTFILLFSLWTYFISNLIFITTTHKRLKKIFELLTEQRRSLSTGFNFRFLLNDVVHISLNGLK